MPAPIDQTTLELPVSIFESPSGADDWQVAEDKIDTAIERLQQVQDQLAADPAGSFASVEARLDAVIHADGSIPLTADWNAGAFTIQAQKFTSGGDDTMTVNGSVVTANFAAHSDTIAVFESHVHTDTANSAGVYYNARSRGTEGSETVVQDADVLGSFLFVGHDGTDYATAASIVGAVDGTPGNDDMPGRLLFLTSPDGSQTLAERMRIDNAGLVSITKQFSVDSDVFFIDDVNNYIGIGSNTTNANNQLNILMDASKDILIDGTTNPRQIDTGVMRFEQTPAIDNTRCITYNVHNNNKINTHAVVVNYDSKGLQAGESGSSFDINLDTPSGSSGVVRGFEGSVTGEGSTELHLIHADPGVVPVSHFSGTFINVEQAWEDDSGFTDRTAAFNSTSTDVQIFANDNAVVYWGMAAVFSEISIDLAIAASGAGIAPVFEYSDGVGGWTAFTPSDESQGFRQSGLLSWMVADLIGWAQDTVNGTSGKFWIRITRTRNALTTPPTENTLKVASVNIFEWDENGDVSINKISAAGQLILSGDITPSQITADQDDYDPTSLSTASTLRLSTDASRNITGLAGGSDGRVLFIHNIGSNDIVLNDENASSTAANRFALNSDVTIQADNLVVMQYDSTSSRWRVVAGGGGGGGLSSPLVADLDFATFKAIAMACDNGDTLPTSPSPVIGQFFRHTPTGRDILYKHDGTDWKSMVGFGSMTVFVSTTGTDALTHGTSTGSDAFLTIQFAIDTIPGMVNGNVIINIGSGTFTESPIIRGKTFTGDFMITVNGDTTDDHTGTATSGAITTLTDTGASFGAETKKVIEITGGTGAGQKFIILSNTGTVITIASRSWITNPDATSTYRVYSRNTIIDGNASATQGILIAGQQNVILNDLEISDFAQGSGTNAALTILSYSSVEVSGCHFQTNAGVVIKAVQSFLSIHSNMIEKGDNVDCIQLDMCRASFHFDITHVKAVGGCFFFQTNGGSTATRNFVNWKEGTVGNIFNSYFDGTDDVPRGITVNDSAWCFVRHVIFEDVVIGLLTERFAEIRRNTGNITYTSVPTPESANTGNSAHIIT